MNANDAVNILLVDDQPQKLLSYEAILSDLGENLIKASSGKEALEHLLKTEITVVLMDVSMPEIGGFELAEIIRGHPRYQKTAIIFVSGVHMSDRDRLRGYQSGAVDYVSVPIIPELLRAKVGVFTELYRKRRESERLNQELEQRVAERTAELEASAAKEAELSRRLREADRRKDEFLALLAHELRNPLAPVRNAVNIMRMKDSLDPDLVWCREVIERQSAQLTRLVDDLLDVSRITQGKIKLRFEPVDLADVVEGAVQTSKPLIDARRHELTVTLPDTQTFVDGDEARLIQILANLLNNAAKYQNERGHISLTVARDANEAVIRVTDRGIGIEPETVSQLFELFSQGERAPDRAQGGLGIGLSLVKNLVELHGGSVTGSSRGHGMGSEFVIRLPASSRRTSDPHGHAPSTVERRKGPSRRILVVDDNRDAAVSLAALLRLRGHEVLVAHDGARALDLAASERPSLMLLDIGLPGMDGYEVCRRARQQGLSAKIVAMTGYGQDRDRERSKEAGFDSHMVKPVEISAIVELLAAS